MDSYYLVVVYALSGVFFAYSVFWTSLDRIPTRKLLEHALVSDLKVFALLFAGMVSNFVIDMPISFLISPVLCILGLITLNDEKRRKELIEKELENIENLSESGPIKTVRFLFWFAVCVATCVVFGIMLVRRYLPLLQGFEEHLIAAGIFASVLAGICAFYATCCLYYFAPKENRENVLDEKDRTDGKQNLRDRIVAYRDGKTYLWVFPTALIIGSLILFVYSPFSRDLIDRTSWRYTISESDFRHAEVAEASLPGDIAALDLAVPDARYAAANGSLSACIPLGFAMQEEGRFLWSGLALDFLRREIRSRLEESGKKIYLEDAADGSDLLSFVFLYVPENRDFAFELLRQDIFNPGFYEKADFETGRKRFVERLRLESRDPQYIAEAFAPAAWSLACRSDTRRLSVFRDLDAVTPERLRDHVAACLRKRRSFVGEIAPETIGKNPMQSLLRQFDDSRPDASPRFRDDNPQPVPGECRVHWDLEYRAVVDCWPIPDPAKYPYEHAALVVAIRLLQQKTVAIVQSPGGPKAAHFGLVAGSDGLAAYAATVWPPETPLEESRRRCSNVFDLPGEKIDRDKFGEQKRELSQYFCPRWSGQLVPLFRNWSINRFRYGNRSEDEPLYRNLAIESIRLSARSLRNETARHFVPDKSLRVILEPD